MKKNKTFLKRPEYPGGKEAFKEYIKKNLIYPDKALEHSIQGTVLLSAVINDNGDVSNVKVEKGIGYGCDEEAVRLIEGVQYGGVKNRGVRLKTKKKFRINFKPPQKKKKVLKYKVVAEKKKTEEKKTAVNSYSYSINIERK